MLRLFIAIDLSDRLKKELTKIKGEIPRARWVRKEQIHLTIRFIGEVDDKLFGAVKKELSEIKVTQFFMSVSGVGYFISQGKIKVIWAGVEVNENVRKLRQEIDQALKAAGIPGEKRKFSPHITLARLENSPLSNIKAYLDKYKPIKYRQFKVSEFHLYSSALNHKGTIHKKEVSYALAED